MVFNTKPADFNKRFDIVGCYVLCVGEFLVLQRLPHKASGGKWGLPAGKAESNENLEQALIREVEEETGIRLSSQNVEHFKSVFVRDGAFDIEWHMFSTKLDAKPEVVLQPTEHSSFRWVAYPEVQSMDLIHDLKESNDMFFNR